MIPPCEHRAEPCVVRPLPSPASQTQQPGVVDVGTVQSTNLSFADALAAFRAAHRRFLTITQIRIGHLLDAGGGWTE